MLQGNARKIKRSNEVQPDANVRNIPCQLVLNGYPSPELHHDDSGHDNCLVDPKSRTDIDQTSTTSTTKREEFGGSLLAGSVHKVRFLFFVPALLLVSNAA